jgi:hypothetical protein
LHDAADKIAEAERAANALADEPRIDARPSRRRRVLKAGIVASNDRRLTVACTVRDLSESGARLRADSSVGIPDTFELIVETDGLEANCEVVWRKGSEVGVKFLSPPRIGAAKRVQSVTPLVPTQAPSLRRKPKP